MSSAIRVDTGPAWPIGQASDHGGTLAAVGEIDELDRALVERLRVDGRESNRSLASALGVNEATVASRLRRMEAASIMRVVALTDIEAFGYGYLVFAKLRARGRPLREIGADLAALPEAISVILTAGRFDLIVVFLARDRKQLGEIVGTVVPTIPGIDEARYELALEILRFDSLWALLNAPAQTAAPTVATDAVDSLDVSIIELLQRDARSSNRRIAADLGVSEGTIRARIRRMEEENLIRIQAISDVVAFGFTAHAYVGIQAEAGYIEEVAKGLVACEPINFIVRSLGDFHFLCVVTAEDRAGMEAIILDRIGAIPGVRRTETLESWQALKHTYTWARLV